MSDLFETVVIILVVVIVVIVIPPITPDSPGRYETLYIGDRLGPYIYKGRIGYTAVIEYSGTDYYYKIHTLIDLDPNYELFSIHHIGRNYIKIRWAIT